MVGEQDIRIRSYLLWEAAGRPHGRDTDFWLRARAELETEAGQEPKPSIHLAVAFVPRVRICSPPTRTTALRVAPREPKLAASAAMR